MLNQLWQPLRWYWRYGLFLTIFGLLFALFIPRATILRSDQWGAIAYDLTEQKFDFVSWEVAALRTKFVQSIGGLQAYMSEAQRSQFVRDYMADLSRAQSLEAEIAAAYSDPRVVDPDGRTATQQAERDALRADLTARQATMEAILEGQVAAVLLDEGFGVAGRVWPPISMHFTRVPNLLVGSPRDTIRMDISLPLDPLTVDERATIEAQVAADYDISTLIVPLGGIALYPAMIFETTSISYAVETFAHEWLHHYLFFYPLGLQYFSGTGFAGETRIINETTADYFGKEVARTVLARYYPEQPLPALPRLPSEAAQSAPQPATSAPPAFDFGAEMNTTRVTVDALLVEGLVETAERYMEMRRQVFFDNGYRLRKLNQAFFAFYGGYQAGGGISGAGGADPIGPSVIEIRQHSPSLRDFVVTMRSITSRAALLDTAESLRGLSAP